VAIEVSSIPGAGKFIVGILIKNQTQDMIAKTTAWDAVVQLDCLYRLTIVNRDIKIICQQYQQYKFISAQHLVIKTRIKFQLY